MHLASTIRMFWRMHRRQPTFLSFNVSNRCNETCPMCEVWRNLLDDLTLPEMEPIFRDLKRFGIMLVEISGGEPFLRKDIFEIFALLDRVGLPYTTTSNGTLFTDANVEKLHGLRGLMQLAVSVDSLERGLYAQLRGKDLLPLVLRNLDRLVERGPRVPIKINFTMSRVNFRETLDVLAYARERGLYLSVFPVNQGDHFLHRRSDPLFEVERGDREAMSAIFRDLARRRRAGEPLWEYSRFYRLAADYVLGRPVGPCDAGALYLDLHADGKLAVCVEHKGFADLRQQSFAEAWALVGTQRDKVRACHEQTPCCYTCTYNISLTARYKMAFAWETARVRGLLPLLGTWFVNDRRLRERRGRAVAARAEADRLRA